jgi:hypothetical protein
MRDAFMMIATLCFFAALVGIIKPYIGNMRRKHFAWSALGLFVFMMIVVPKDPSQKQLTEGGDASEQPKTAQKATRQKSDAAPDQAYFDQLQREIASLKKQPGLKEIPDSKDSVLIGIVLIGARAQIIEKAPKNLRPETKAAEVEYIRLIKAYQRDAFPKLRKAQGKVWRDTLWENDIDVAILGPSNSTVRFTAGMFAANRNIKAAHEAASDTLAALRFKKDSYEWYRGAAGYEYTMDHPADDAIATFSEGGGWSPLEF